MKQFVYPAVCYKDYENETTTLLLPDTDILTSGANVEEAFLGAKDYLKTFVDCSIKFGGTIPEATSFDDTMRLNPRKSVLLIDAESRLHEADGITQSSLEGGIGGLFE